MMRYYTRERSPGLEQQKLLRPIARSLCYLKHAAGRFARQQSRRVAAGAILNFTL